MRGTLFLLLVMLALSATPVYAQDITFQVIVLYDSNGDGINEGVGQGTVVNAREPSSLMGTIQPTDQFSSAFFNLHTGLYRITAFPKSTRFLFEWVCAETVFVSESNDTLVLECEEFFFMRFPWTRK